MLSRGEILQFISCSYNLEAVFIGRYVEIYSDEYLFDISSVGLVSDHDGIYQFNSIDDLKIFLDKKGLTPISTEVEQLSLL